MFSTKKHLLFFNIFFFLSIICHLKNLLKLKLKLEMNERIKFSNHFFAFFSITHALELQIKNNKWKLILHYEFEKLIETGCAVGIFM